MITYLLNNISADQMEKTINLSENNKQSIANNLAILLADEYVLYTKTRNAYWNVKDTAVYDIPVFFEIQFAQLDDIIDRVAKRIRELGYYTAASLKIFSQTSHLYETICGTTDSHSFMQGLLFDHESIIRYLKTNNQLFLNEQNNGDDIEDFISQIMLEHEKMAWFLRTHIKQV